MQGRYNMVGVIYIDTSTSPQKVIQHGAQPRFAEEHLKLMVAIGHQAALAIEDTRHYSALVQAERLAAVGQTITSLSHHIKNVLQGIRAASWLIKDGLSRHDEAMIKKGWEFVEKHQERISNLVLDMLTFSKEREPELVPSDLNAVAGEVVELMAARADEKHVRLAFTPDRRLPAFAFDPEGLHRAVLNVVTNALDAAERSDDAGTGQVTVVVEYDSDAAVARVAIEDDGPGISADELDHIFSLFVSHKGNRGTGLGLPVSQKIVKEHGGRIRVTSEPGRGSRFVLEVPVTALGRPETQRENAQTKAV